MLLLSPVWALAGERIKFKVEPEEIARLYDEWVMPLTKEVEVQYLLRRLG
jgi:hypothetical protein